MGFIGLTRGLISLVNDNHVDKNIKESLVYEYLYNRPKQWIAII